METHATIILSITLVVYAFYTLTVFASIILLLRAKVVWYRWLLATTCVLYVSITTAMFLFIFGTGARTMNYVYNTFALVAHILADLILVWRCYLIWERRWRIIMVPSMQLLASLAFGLIRVVHGSKHTFTLHSIHPPAEEGFSLTVVGLIGFYVVSLIANLVLTGLSAGRIWFLTQRGHFVLQETNRSQYHAVIAMIVESGLTYSLCLLAVIGSFIAAAAGVRTKELDLALGITISLALQASGLMPTLILVRSALVSRFRSDSSHARAVAAAARSAQYMSPYASTPGPNILSISATVESRQWQDIPLPVSHPKTGFESCESMELGERKGTAI